VSGLPGRQKAGRYRTIGFQAVGVVVIAGFVFIAILRPSDPGDLSGIDAPGPDRESRVDRPEDPKDRKDRKDRPKPKTRNGDRDGSETGNSRRLGLGALAALVEGVGSGGVGASGSAAAGAPTVPGGGDGSSGGSGDPPGNQYGDLPGVLMAEVGIPAIFREIDP
jgi:hypothetical protein